jgi:hypothetical protein
MTNIATRNQSSGLGIALSTSLVLAMRNNLCMCLDALRGKCLQKRRARKNLSISVSRTLPNGDPACYILIPPRARRLLMASSFVSDILLISYPEAFIKRHVLAKDTHRRHIVRMHSRQQVLFNVYRLSFQDTDVETSICYRSKSSYCYYMVLSQVFPRRAFHDTVTGPHAIDWRSNSTAKLILQRSQYVTLPLSQAIMDQSGGLPKGRSYVVSRVPALASPGAG